VWLSLNRNGPKIDLCGIPTIYAVIPLKTSYQQENYSLACFRSDRKVLIHRSMLLSIL